MLLPHLAGVRSPECAKVTFAEQVSGLTSRYARRTPAVTAVLEAVALALGGRAGARLSGRLAACGPCRYVYADLPFRANVR